MSAPALLSEGLSEGLAVLSEDGEVAAVIERAARSPRASTPGRASPLLGVPRSPDHDEAAMLVRARARRERNLRRLQDEVLLGH